MKKVLSLFLIGLMCVGLTGCGEKEKNVRQKLEENFTDSVKQSKLSKDFMGHNLLIIFPKDDNGGKAANSYIFYDKGDTHCFFRSDDIKDFSGCDGGKKSKAKIDKVLKDADITYKELDIPYDELMKMEGLEK